MTVSEAVTHFFGSGPLLPRRRQTKFNRIREQRPILNVIESAEVGLGPMDCVAKRIGIHPECRLARTMFMARIVTNGLYEPHIE